MTPLQLWNSLCALVALLLFWVPFQVGADELSCSQDAICRAHLKQASEYYKRNNYSRALLEFQAAYDRLPEPRLLLNLGRTLQKLGHPREAIEYYKRCQLLLTEDAELQSSLQKYISEARVQMGESPDAPDATPRPPGLAPGSGLDVEPPPAGEVDPNKVNGAAAGTEAANPGGLPLAAMAPGLSAIPAPPTRPVYKRWWFWTIVGVAVAGGVAGIAAGVATRSATTPRPVDPDGYFPTF